MNRQRTLQSISRPIPYPTTKNPSRWQLLIASFIIHTLVPSTFCTYGIYIMYMEDVGFSIRRTIWTPALFLVTLIIVKPWCHQWTEHWVEIGKTQGRWWTCSAILLAACGIYLMKFNSIILSSIAGILTGFGTALALQYVKSIVNDNFTTQPILIMVMEEAAMAFGQFIVPHLIYGFIRFYTLQSAPLMQCTLLIQTLPSVLLLKNARLSLPTLLSRYSDFQMPLSLLSEQEMVVFNRQPQNSNFNIDINLSTVNEFNTPPKRNSLQTFRQWQSLPNISNATTNDNSESADTTTPGVFGNSALDDGEENNERRKNSNGVEILPEIPEENESVISDTNSYSKNINRYSMISIKLDEMITKQDANDIYVQNTEVFIHGNSENVIVPKNPHRHRYVYGKYHFQRKTRNMIKFVYKNIVQPFGNSLKIYAFYLAFVSNISLYLGWFSFLCLMPVFARRIDRTLSFQEVIFLISIAAFLWIAFLITTPWYSELPKRHMKYILMISFFVTSVGFYVIPKSTSHELLTTGSIVFGFGFGAMSFSIDASNKDVLGVQHWPTVEKTLYTTTSLVICIFICTMYFLSIDIVFYFKIVSAIQLFAAILWSSSVFIYKMTNRECNLHEVLKNTEVMF